MLSAMADAYERDAMPGVGEVLHRQKVTSPRWAMAIATLSPVIPLVGIGLVSLLGGQILAGVGALAGAAALFGVLTFVMITFASARIAVSEGELHLQLGMAGPKIPMGEIASVAIAPSGTSKVGMGVGNDLRGTTTYRLWGDNARAVHVAKTDGTKLVIVTKEPEALRAAIEEALSRKGRAAPRVRVGDAEGEAEDETAASESARKTAGR